MKVQKVSVCVNADLSHGSCLDGLSMVAVDKWFLDPHAVPIQFIYIERNQWLLNVNIILDTVWTYLGAMSLSYCHNINESLQFRCNGGSVIPLDRPSQVVPYITCSLASREQKYCTANKGKLVPPPPSAPSESHANCKISSTSPKTEAWCVHTGVSFCTRFLATWNTCM